jgi:hypothetical protein
MSYENSSANEADAYAPQAVASFTFDNMAEAADV